MRIPLPFHKGFVLMRKSDLSFIFSLFLAISFCLSSSSVLAEGSKDLAETPGYRLFLDTRDTHQIKVFAKVGEFINVGASHIGIEGGFITVYRPDGTMAALIDGSNGNEGIIFNKTMEAAGPTGGGSTNGAGYEPGGLEVMPGQEGIWTVYFGFPSYSPMDFPNILNSSFWTRANDQPKTPRVVLAWDVTVTKQAAGNYGGATIEGRVYSNELVLIINQNGYSTSPSFHVLTKQGFIFKIDFMDADPFRFPISSNSCGFVHHDLQPVYTSQPRSMIVKSDDPNSWVSGSYYLFEPQAEDYDNGKIINNKMFFNYPNDDLPSFAQVTDVFRENTHETWLRINPFITTLEITDFELVGIGNSGLPCPPDFIESGEGGIFQFISNLGGTAVLELDINNDGDYEDDIDRVLYNQIGIGSNSIPWDLKDGLGTSLALNVIHNIRYRITLRGGESHVLLTDVENNQGGVSFYLENSGTNNNNDHFYFDHTPIGGPVSGGSAPGNPTSTNVPFSYQNNFGNNNILDYWAYYEYDGKLEGKLEFTIIDNCGGDPGPDRDGDGIADALDIDDDNDGIADKSEFCNPATGYGCLPGGLDPSRDADGDGIQNLEDADDPNFINPCSDLNGDGICDQIAAIYDTDGDGIANHFDIDSDNDGIPDLIEAGHEQPDIDRNGVIDGAPAAFGANGLYNAIASDPDDFNAIEIYTRWDADADEVPDHFDLDSDNDGIHDVEESGHGDSDSNDDGRIDDGAGNPPVTGASGLAPSIDPVITGVPIPILPDFDGDLVPDWHDLDSDNDLINDVHEGGNIDNDGDGRIGLGIPTVDQNGLAFGLNIQTTSKPLDSDADLVPNYHDLDTDNDGVNDVKEANGNDPDNDGFPETGAITVNEFGQPIIAGGIAVFSTSSPMDTDSDSICDYMDLDSDNDVITDIAEHNYPDPDNDGRVGDGIPNVNVYGQAIDYMPTSQPTDTDGDGIPDMQELDSDDDGIFDVREANQPDPDNDGMVGIGSPTVGNNGTSTNFLATSKPTDTDANGIPDFQELDSDADGISDTHECPDPSDCKDGDNDNTADFQDPDRDNDGIFDGYECETGFPCPDTDGDGIADLDDLDTDGDMLLDIDECPAGDPCPDANFNGIPEWREYFCNPNVIVPVAENVTSNGTSFCIGSMATFNAENSVDVEGDSVLYQWVGPNGFNFSKMTTEFGPFPVDIPNLTQDFEGVYTLYLYTEEGCVSEPVSISINFDLTPETPDIQSNEEILCAGGSLLLTTNDYQGVNPTYHWYFDDGIGQVLLGTSSVPSFSIPNIEVNQAGAYFVQVEINNCMSLASISQNIEVNNIAAQTPSLAVDNDVLCVGDLIELNSSIVQGGNVQYEWWFDNGSTVISLGITDVPTFYIDNADTTNTGIYNVSVIVNGCESQKSNSQDIIVSDALVGVQPFLTAENNIICFGGSIELSTAIVAGNNILYQWWFDDGNGTQLIETTNDPYLSIDNVDANNTGNYSITIASGNCASPLSNSLDISINVDFANQSPVLSVNSLSLCEGEEIQLESSTVTGSNIEYQWWLNGPNGTVLLATTITPNFFISDANVNYSGSYYIVAINGVCESLSSNLEFIEVIDDSNLITPSLSVLEDKPCEGETIELNATIINGSNITYSWWYDDGNGFVLLETTDLPTFFIYNASPVISGVYAVNASIGNCETQLSNAQDIVVTGDLSSQTPALSANQNLICEGEDLILNSTIVTGSNVAYHWYFDNGSGPLAIDTTDIPTLFINSATQLNSGTYTVLVSVGNCESQLSNAEQIIITDLYAMTPALSIENETVCEGGVLELNSSSVNGTDVTYNWWFDNGDSVVVIAVTDHPTLFINNASLNQQGVYMVSANVGECETQLSNAQDVVIQMAPDIEPFNTTDSNNVACIGDAVELSASLVIGASYQWVGPNGFNSDLPNPVIEEVSVKNAGNYFVIIKTQEGCAFQSEQTEVFVYDEITATEDFFQITIEDSLTTNDLLLNDFIGNISNWEINIISNPINGVIEFSDLNQIVYRPNENRIGNDVFIYEICNPDCPDLCEQAVVNVRVLQYKEDDGACFVPNVITPNEDGANDAFVIPCLETEYTNNNLRIFNRWGDLVFEAQPYKNDWKGTYRNTQLPPGTYFYVLQLDKNDDHCLQGYFTLTR